MKSDYIYRYLGRKSQGFTEKAEGSITPEGPVSALSSGNKWLYPVFKKSLTLYGMSSFKYRSCGSDQSFLYTARYKFSATLPVGVEGLRGTQFCCCSCCCFDWVYGVWSETREGANLCLSIRLRIQFELDYLTSNTGQFCGISMPWFRDHHSRFCSVSAFWNVSLMSLNINTSLK